MGGGSLFEAIFDAFMSIYDARAGRVNAEREERWTDAAQRLGLKYVEGAGRTLTGRMEGLDVLFESFAESGEDLLTRIAVGGRGKLPKEVAFEAEAVGESLRKALGKNDLQLGVPEFDSAVNIQGPQDAALAVLNSEVRKVLPQFLRTGGSVAEGEVRRQWDGEPRDATAIEEAVHSAVAMARMLLVESIPAALCANATGDPDPKVRWKNLAALADHHGQTPEARSGLESGLRDSHPEIRFLAASQLSGGPEVQKVLTDLFLDESPDEVLRAGALDRLGEILVYEAIAPLVVRGLGDKQPLVREAAVKLAGGARDVSTLEALEGLTGSEHEGIGRALAQAFASIGGDNAEEGLLALLRHPAATVRREAAVALGRIGTVRAVEPLLPLTQVVLGEASVKDAARDAIRAIQARLGDAGAGRLSVVEDHDAAGGLSVGPGERSGRGK